MIGSGVNFDRFRATSDAEDLKWETAIADDSWFDRLRDAMRFERDEFEKHDGPGSMSLDELLTNTRGNEIADETHHGFEIRDLADSFHDEVIGMALEVLAETSKASDRPERGRVPERNA